MKVVKKEECNKEQQSRLSRIKIAAYAFLCGFIGANVVNEVVDYNTYYVLEEQRIIDDKAYTTEFIVVNKQNLDRFQSSSFKKYNVLKKTYTDDVSILMLEGYDKEAKGYKLPAFANYEIVESSEKLVENKDEYRFVSVGGVKRDDVEKDPRLPNVNFTVYKSDSNIIYNGKEIDYSNYKLEDIDEEYEIKESIKEGEITYGKQY